MARIVVDAGHGGSDPGAVYQGRQEKDDNLRLALAVGNILENAGQEVIYTRTTDVFNTPFEKAQIANNAGADYFLSLHRNSTEVPGTGSGVQTLIYDMSGIKVEIAENILNNLVALGFRDLGVVERPGLVVLRRTNMPAVMVETGFINNTEDNTKFDNQFNEIAQAIADGLLSVINANVETIGYQKGRPPIYYRIQVGAFRNYDNAQRNLNHLHMEGYPAFILFDGEVYKIQVGAYSILENAIRMEQQLRSNGYGTFITSN